MKQAQAMQKKMADAQEKVASSEFSGTSGGGMVSITISGKGEVRKIKIDPSLANKEEIEILEDLIIAAFGDAKKKADSSTEDVFSGAMGGFSLPPGFKMPF
jgi:DNA-binding YbaB/EbfC family protein